MSQRSDTAMFNEGQILTLAAQRDVETAAEHARGVIDGCFNALIRFDGPEKAFSFATAVADRVAGGLKQPTAWPASFVVEKIDMPMPQPLPAPPPAPSRRDRLVAWLWWWLS